MFRVVVSSLALLLVVVPAAAAAPGIDTRGMQPTIVLAAETGAFGPLGDVNGDGVADVAVGLAWERTAGQACSPDEERAEVQDVAPVFFGGPRLAGAAAGPADLRLRCPSTPQLEDRRPGGVSYGTSVGGEVIGAGDIDGDGIGDLAVGAVGAAAPGRPNSGVVHVRFGRPGGEAADLRVPDPRGFRILGPARGSEIGARMAALGDVSGDGRPDLALPYAIDLRRGRRPPSAPRAGLAVVFGAGRDGGTVDLREPGRDAAIVTGLRADGVTVAPAGDLDRDGIGDVALGLPGRLERTATDGRVVVVAGPLPAGTTPLARLRKLMELRGDLPVGGTLAPAGDVDGDGTPDLAVGTGLPEGTLLIGGGGEPPPSAFVVRGRAGTRLDLRRPSAAVRVLTGRSIGAGEALQALGDVTGDGVPDLAIGDAQASPDCRAGAGAVFVVRGDRAFADTTVESAAALRVDGAQPGGRLAVAPGRAADVTGDGRADLVVAQKPSDNAAFRNLHVLPLTRPSSAVRPLPGSCLTARAVRPSLARVQRGEVVVDVRSSLGTGQRHTVRLELGAAAVAPGTRRAALDRLLGRAFTRRLVRTTLRFAGPGRRRVRLRLPRTVVRPLAGARGAYLWLQAEQRLGRDEISPGAAAGRFVPLGRAPRLR